MSTGRFKEKGVVGSMLDFSRLGLADAPKLRPFLRHTYSRTCDHVFGTIMMWRDMWPLEFAVYDDKALFMRIEMAEGNKGYLMPIGMEPEYTLGILNDFHQGQKQFYNVAQEELETLQRVYGNVSAMKQVSAGDYLYNADSIATLNGRKLHGQRNHCNYFERTWAFHFEKVTNDNVRDVRVFFERFSDAKSSVFFQEAYHKILEVLDNLDIYQFSSLALYAEDKIIGCTFGTLLGDTLYVSVEQADRNYRGAYPKLASAFASAHLDAGALFINREDDMGEEGLRSSKQAWNPCQIIEKYSVTAE